MATKKAASASVFYRDPAALPDEDGKIVTQTAKVIDGDVGGVITVELDNGVTVQVAPLGEQQIGAAWYVAEKSELLA